MLTAVAQVAAVDSAIIVRLLLILMNGIMYREAPIGCHGNHVINMDSSLSTH